MDVVLRDDDSNIRTANAPANFAPLRHIAYTLYRRTPGKGSIRMRCKIAAWDDAFLATLVTA